MITAQPPGKKYHAEESKRVHLSSERGDILDIAVSDIHVKQRERLVEKNAKAKGHRYMNLKKFPISNASLLILDRKYCEEHNVVCFYFEGEQMRLGSLNPEKPILVEKAKELEKIYRSDVVVYEISKDSLGLAFKRYDAIPKKIAAHDESFELTEDILKKQQEKVKSLQQLNEVISKTPITEVLGLVVASALKSGASDIHIEAEAEAIKIRFRIDGVLHDIGALPKDAWGRVISRIKLIAGLKLNVMNEPQDGRFTINYRLDKVEVRTSTVPTSHGESVVMRLLQFSIDALQFDKLGVIGYTLSILNQEIAKPNGMILTTGPTGSGKTTTLYAILHLLNDPETKILTLEDPVEYKLKGINQTQIDMSKNFDFAKGLRSLLRQDPDIIMVGEIRDLETADTAINAALTGHLMLSTLHTNSSAGAIPRFLAMGSKNFLIAPAINAIVGQRLVRKLCEHCKIQETPDEVILARVKKALEPLKERTDLGIDVDLNNIDSHTFFTGKGCKECNDLGYTGRIGIFEILTMNKDLEKIILSGKVSEYDIKDTAISHGMITMLQDGLMKVLLGFTSVAEVFRQVE